MIRVDLQVMHKSFGLGVITAINGKYITVNFENARKTFVYPDIFEKFLTLADGTVSDAIKADLAASKEKKEKIIAAKNEENLKDCMTLLPLYLRAPQAERERAAKLAAKKEGEANG